MSGIPTSSSNLAGQHAAAQLPWLTSRRCLLGLLVAATSLAGAFLMLRILQESGLTPLRGVILILFTMTFAWIALAFWSAVFGLVVVASRRDPLTLTRLPAIDDERRIPIVSRSVLAMPIHNENPGLVVAALEATARSLIATGESHHFEVFVLSDTTDADIAEDEARQIAGLQRRLQGDLTLHYRRRPNNQGRKAGNIAEFCRRWGRRYDYMVVLDADSRMEGEALLALVRAMQNRPAVGLIQTVPLPARQVTLFGRLAEFAASLYAQTLAAGQSCWQGDAANYWGHNAILRVSAFMDHAGLPILPGRPPLGGEILSHDFVEAALLRRGGWEVQLDTRIHGSFEEMPGNLIDFARRDRRWTQGNLQHLRLLSVPGLHGMSRWHFLLGAMAFLSSLLWLGVLVAGSLDAMLHSPSNMNALQGSRNDLPFWFQARPTLIYSLLGITAALLLLPKCLGLLHALATRAADYGGPWRLLSSALMEGISAILLAPLMMAFHSAFIMGVLTGASVDWGAQAREGRLVAWREALRHSALFTLIGILWASLVAWLAPGLFWWLSPVWLGLLLAPGLIRVSGNRRIADRLARMGLLQTPEATSTEILQDPPVLEHTDRIEVPEPPPTELPGEMLRQSFDRLA